MAQIADTVTLVAPASAVWVAIESPDEHVMWHPLASAIKGAHALGEVRECSVTKWTSGFRLAQDGESTVVTAWSNFRPKWFVRPMLPMIRNKFHQTQREMLDGLRVHVEGRADGHHSFATTELDVPTNSTGPIRAALAQGPSTVRTRA